MFSDPFVLTRNHSTITADVTHDLTVPASERAADHSTYRAFDADQNDHVLFIGHNYGRRARFTARYTISGFTPSLLAPDQNTTFSQAIYVVADVPLSGPVESTTSATNLFRRQMKGIGSLLVSVGAGVDPLFYRAIKGET